MSAEKAQEKTLVLEIAIPDFWADDLPAAAKEFEIDIFDIVCDEIMRTEVGITCVTLPSPKSLNNEFEVVGQTGRLVGARVLDKRVF